MRKLVWILLVAVFLGGLVTAPQANAGPGGEAQLARYATDLRLWKYPGSCVDADSVTWPGNPTKVQMWSCNSQWNQRWTTYWIDSLVRIDMIDDRGRVKCLDGWEVNRVKLWDCNGSSQQLWEISGHYEDQFIRIISLINVLHRLCMDIHPHAGGNGLEFTLYPCHFDYNQQFAINKS